MISIIIPVFNVKPYLKECLDSVLAQSVSGWEAICVDDGSTDGSEEILDAYATQDCRIKVLHQQNTGVSAARNLALRQATGELVSFVDADDVLSKDFLKEMMGIVESEPEVDLVSAGHLSFIDGEKMVFPFRDINKKVYDVVDVGTRVPNLLIPIWGGVFRRKIFPAHLFRSYSIGEDLLFVTECLCSAKKIAVCTKALYGYRYRMGSAMRSPVTVRKLKDRIGYCHDRILSLIQSGKEIDQRVFRGIGLSLTEDFIFALLQLSTFERDGMWRLWYDNLGWLRQFKIFPLWTTLVIRICETSRMHSAAYVLCYIPVWLKRHGLHR